MFNVFNFFLARNIELQVEILSESSAGCLYLFLKLYLLSRVACVAWPAAVGVSVFYVYSSPVHVNTLV